MNDTVKCPHCGVVLDELWEHFKDYSDEVAEGCECDSCGFGLTISRRIDVTYSVTSPEVPLDAFCDPTRPTLEDHAREWWLGQGKEMPKLDGYSPLAESMHKEWLEKERENAVSAAKVEADEWWNKHRTKVREVKHA